MHDDDRYERWKQQRGHPPISADFVDRVMARLEDRLEQPAQTSWLRGLFFSRPAQVALCSLACAVWVFRLLLLAGLFVGPLMNKG
jgi:hypothetical protein